MKIQTYAGVIVKYYDKILLCKRAPNASYPETWSIPQGKVEKGESTRNAAMREFFEETNIFLPKNELGFSGVLLRMNKSKTKIKGPLYIYSIDSKYKLEPDLQNAVDGHEHTDCGYFSIKEMNNLNIDEKLLIFLKKKLLK